MRPIDSTRARGTPTTLVCRLVRRKLNLSEALQGLAQHQVPNSSLDLSRRAPAETPSLSAMDSGIYVLRGEEALARIDSSADDINWC